MSQIFVLEEFASVDPHSKIENFLADAGPVLNSDSETMSTEEFERGYKAGWDDAAIAETEDQTRISAEFARNLQDIGFTFHEARNHVLKSLDNLLSELIGGLVPEIAAKAIGAMIVDEVMPMAEVAADTPIQIVVAPSAVPALDALLADYATFPVEILEEPSLCAGQVFLRAGDSEKLIDFSKPLAAVSGALLAMYQTNERMLDHG